MATPSSGSVRPTAESFARSRGAGECLGTASPSVGGGLCNGRARSGARPRSFAVRSSRASTRVPVSRSRRWLGMATLFQPTSMTSEPERSRAGCWCLIPPAISWPCRFRLQRGDGLWRVTACHRWASCAGLRRPSGGSSQTARARSSSSAAAAGSLRYGSTRWHPRHAGGETRAGQEQRGDAPSSVPYAPGPDSTGVDRFEETLAALPKRVHFTAGERGLKRVLPRELTATRDGPRRVRTPGDSARGSLR